MCVKGNISRKAAELLAENVLENPDTVTTEVAQAGDYYIDYYALVNFAVITVVIALMGIFVNGSEVNPIKTR